MINEWSAALSLLDAIPARSADLYASALQPMIVEVNREMGGRTDLQELIGQNPLAMIEMSHLHHAQLMLAVFRLHSFELLAHTIPWFYRVYHSRGFSSDFFLID